MFQICIFFINLFGRCFIFLFPFKVDQSGVVKTPTGWVDGVLEGASSSSSSSSSHSSHLISKRRPIGTGPNTLPCGWIFIFTSRSREEVQDELFQGKERRSGIEGGDETQKRGGNYFGNQMPFLVWKLELFCCLGRDSLLECMATSGKNRLLPGRKV